MDFSKFTTPDWLKIGGAAVFLIGGFLGWLTFDGDSAGNVFDFFLTGTVPWLLIMGTAVVTVLRANGTIKPGGAPWPLIMVLATVVAALLVTLRFLMPGLGDFPDGLGRGIGLILCWLAALATAAGSVMAFTAAGGNLKDLTDPNKLRQAFDRPGDQQAPPPPPPPGNGGGMPPPPPPPV
jgi:hypothetical protein